jgi:MFS-type transporter involved in bile tolerance (Atg22 family)
MLAFAGVVGLWGIAFFSIDLQKSIFEKMYEARGIVGREKAGLTMIWAAITSIMINLGAFVGMTGFSTLTARYGRRITFALSMIAAAASTILVFLYMNDHTDLFWMLPLMGICQLSLFGGYAIYFPELFPTRLRSTGTSFCYNVGRFVAASGPWTFGLLQRDMFAGTPEPMRYAGVTMCVVYLIGLAALPFLPETKGHPLPED